MKTEIIKTKIDIGSGYYYDCKVVSRNIITDFVQGIRNWLGLELIGYTNVLKNTVKELEAKAPKLKWFRIDTEMGNKGVFIISIYGERK